LADDFKANLTRQLRRDEGEVLYAFQDTLGFLTIGCGRLIDHRKNGGITAEESAYLLNNDIERTQAELFKRAPWVEALDDARKGVIVAMAFQIGVAGLMKFKTTLALIQAGRYADASDAMLQSLWSRQTPARAKRLAMQMKTGQWV
jgi:lysozyme